MLFEQALFSAVADLLGARTACGGLLFSVPQPANGLSKQANLVHDDVLSSDNSTQSGENMVHTVEAFAITQGGSTCLGRLPSAFSLQSPVTGGQAAAAVKRPSRKLRKLSNGDRSRTPRAHTHDRIQRQAVSPFQLPDKIGENLVIDDQRADKRVH